jgi:DNA-binding NarL/FixJ family response regulator
MGRILMQMLAGVLPAAITSASPGESLVAALRAVTTGAQVTPEGYAVPPPAERSDPPGLNLSEREEQVLSQISHGLSRGQGAIRLGISPHGRQYVKRIRAKLGVGNKAELTRVALLGRPTKPVRCPGSW